MKSTAVALALAMAFAPAFSLAQQTTTTTASDDNPDAGGVAAGPLPAFGSLPAGTFVVGGFVVLAATGVILGVFTGDDSSAAVATTGTN